MSNDEIVRELQKGSTDGITIDMRADFFSEIIKEKVIPKLKTEEDNLVHNKNLLTRKRDILAANREEIATQRAVKPQLKKIINRIDVLELDDILNEEKLSNWKAEVERAWISSRDNPGYLSELSARNEVLQEEALGTRNELNNLKKEVNKQIKTLSGKQLRNEIERHNEEIKEEIVSLTEQIEKVKSQLGRNTKELSKAYIMKDTLSQLGSQDIELVTIHGGIALPKDKERYKKMIKEAYSMNKGLGGREVIDITRD